MTYKINYEANPSPKDIQVLGDGIIEYALQQKSHKPMEFFAFFVRDENNKVLGGCNCAILYGCLYIDYLWISESLRNQDYGTKLMLAAEKQGREQGCTFACVNTMDWEALDFYKKLNYTIEFERHGFEKDSVFYFLRKELKNIF
ncbi:MAG TPA: GNAT family N-acetyltransferase [Gammaproteobacteria bacterium]|nr:GNAT family N-acetyltransferase [Gammaproteobacteria bacterium]